MRDGRATWADLAVELDLTAPAVAQRVRRLQERGVIRQFAAWVAPETVAPVAAFVGVSLGRADAHAAFLRSIGELELVQECHQVSDGTDYLLKVRCGSVGQLAELVTRVLPELAGGGRARTTLVLASPKESPIVPLPANLDA